MIRNVLIIEDKKSHMDALYKIVSEVKSDIKILTAYDIETAYQFSMEYHVHLFLIDIILRPEKPGDVLGLTFAQKIREIENYRFTPIIFITSLEDPKLYSYSQIQCLGYIEKPFSKEQVKKLVLKALEFPIVDDDERYVYFRKDRIVYSKNLKEIIFIENSRRKVAIHCKEDILEIPYKTCGEILAELDSDSFIQCSRYMIVNKRYIERIDYTNRYIKLKGVKDYVEIGAIMRKNFKDKMEGI